MLLTSNHSSFHILDEFENTCLLQRMLLAFNTITDSIISGCKYTLNNVIKTKMLLPNMTKSSGCRYHKVWETLDQVGEC